MTAALVDIFCRSFLAPPAAITLDIDDTCDAVHGRQQLSLFNAHYDTRCLSGRALACTPVGGGFPAPPSRLRYWIHTFPAISYPSWMALI